jgi:predicted RNA-binding protein with PIN domain
MHYIVDGNNVMAQTVGWHKDKRAARRKLIRELTRFVGAHRTNVKVVFDGLPDELFLDDIRYKSVHILYSGPGADADSRIKDLVRTSSYKRDIVVVSSDRDLASFARKQGTKVISSGKFRKMLNEAQKVDRPESDSAHQPSADVEEWLEYFGIEKE